MKAASRFRSAPLHSVLFAVLFLPFLTALPAEANRQLHLVRGQQPGQVEYTGLVDLIIDPAFDNARVTISVDGTKIADGIRSPYRLTVDFWPRAIEHKIVVMATTLEKRRVQWHTTINRGKLPLTVNLRAVDLAQRLFEAETTAPSEDPIAAVELWEGGQKVMALSEAPYRFTVPAEIVAGGFVQVTARTKSGEEAADFWSPGGEVHVENVNVRTVPLFVSVVDRNGQTRDDIDRSLFRILDNDAEGKIVEFGKAFDQPISIALLVDSSASMTYRMAEAARAASSFVQRTLKERDRCAVYAVRDVPRREQELTGDLTLVSAKIGSIRPQGRTALYDAILTAIRELKGEKNRRAIVALTDGVDNASLGTYDEVQKASAEAGIPLYFVAYESDEPDALKHLDGLKYLASHSGGFVATASEQNLSARYGDIEKDLRAQFAIRYQITDYTRQNEWRRVRVVLASPKLTARTIKGYFAP
ncbi:MAG TPA: VWA domain-containing protein [Thermoanaerobaculia bacterium]|nr:VWA domain-containing protein [Thermoanaerobaculia bacterium]